MAIINLQTLDPEKTPFHQLLFCLTMFFQRIAIHYALQGTKHSAICEKPERPEILGTDTGLEFDLREGPAVNGAEPAQY